MIAWWMVGTAVYQLGLKSLIQEKKRNALKLGEQKTEAPAASEPATAAINPWT
jgi:predicted secreted protein